MNYNVYLNAGGLGKSLTMISEEDLKVIVDAYDEGKPSCVINGNKVSFKDLRKISIYNFEGSEADLIRYKYQNPPNNPFGISSYWTPQKFNDLGKDVTRDFIGNNSFGWRKGLVLINNSTELTQTFWNLIHNDIRDIAKPRFDSHHYADSVEAAFKHLNDVIKMSYKGKTNNELDGRDLMAQAFSDNANAFKLVDTTTQSGKNIQEGYKFILMGSMAGIRNPKAHANLVITQEDAIEKIFLASHLLKIFESKIS